MEFVDVTIDILKYYTPNLMKYVHECATSDNSLFFSNSDMTIATLISTIIIHSISIIIPPCSRIFL